jgi:hypothetical protein
MPSVQMSTLGAQASKPGSNPNKSSPMAAGGIKGRVSSAATYIQTNPLAVKIMGGIAGVSLTAISIMSCFAIFNTFLAPLAYIQNVFFLIFGLVITMVSLFPESKMSNFVYEQAHFMSTLTGRGFFFLYLGALLFGAGLSGDSASVTYLLVGSWLLVCSGVYFFLRCRQPSDAQSLPSTQVNGV